MRKRVCSCKVLVFVRTSALYFSNNQERNRDASSPEWLLRGPVGGFGRWTTAIDPKQSREWRGVVCQASVHLFTGEKRREGSGKREVED
jgi:hypothetical protein